jgi:hypothetical protein
VTLLMMSHAYPPKSKMAESSLIFSVQISQEIIKLRKIGKRDLHVILQVLPNEIIKKYIAVPFKYSWVNDI